MSATNDNPQGVAGLGENPCVTVTLGSQRLALPISRIEDIFAVQSVTSVPLAPRHIAGLINLRGAVVTAICLAERLGLPGAEPGRKMMAISVGFKGETIGLLAPNVGDVLDFPFARREPAPAHLRAAWAAHALGVHQIGNELVIELNVDFVISTPAHSEAA